MHQVQKQPNFLFSTPIQIRFTDIDQLKHVTNSVYQQYFDMGRMEYFAHVFGERMDWSGEGLVLVSLSMDYMSPIKLIDKIEVRSRISGIGHKSIKMQQQIYNFTSGCVCSQSTSVLVACKSFCTESIEIPSRWVDKIKAFEPELLLAQSK